MKEEYKELLEKDILGFGVILKQISLTDRIVALLHILDNLQMSKELTAILIPEHTDLLECIKIANRDFGSNNEGLIEKAESLYIAMGKEVKFNYY